MQTSENKSIAQGQTGFSLPRTESLKLIQGAKPNSYSSTGVKIILY